jgi:hypothetical protein
VEPKELARELGVSPECARLAGALISSDTVERRRMSIERPDEIIREVAESMPDSMAEEMLEAIMLPPDERAALIGRLHQGERSAFAELLIDLEEDRQLGLDFAQVLKARRGVGPAD